MVASYCDWAIYHAVTIEMYYNFYYALKHVPNHRPESADFKFKSMWYRGPDVKAGFLNDLIRTHRKRNKYDNIVIVHDISPTVWGRMYKQLEDNANIFCFSPMYFVLYDEDISSPVELTYSRTVDMMRERDEEYMFDLLVKELQHLPKWRSINNLHWSHLSNSSLFSIANA